MSQARWLVLIDFDGTLTSRDADFQIADALLPPERQGAYRPMAEAYERLEISTLRYFEAYLDLLGCSREAIANQAARIELRPGAAELLAFCRDHDLELRVVSEGLDAYIRPALDGAGLSWVPISCNRLKVDELGAFRILPALGAQPCERCLSCKGTHVRRARARGLKAAVIGDGASDLCAARLADLVLARDSLLEHCRREGIPHHPWESFAEVVELLRSHLLGHAATCRARQA